MHNELIDTFLSKIENGYVLGTFSKTTDSNFVEILGLNGMDFVILDMEHGFTSTETLANHIRAALYTNMLPIVRVPNPDSRYIGVALDLGALGVQIPNVTSADQLMHVVANAKFFPNGRRGVCRYVRAAEFSRKDKLQYFEHANESIIVVQVEGTEGIRNLDEIIDVPGIDVLFIGPYDLSQSLGVPGQVDSDIVQEHISKIVEACNKKGITVGTFIDNIELASSFHRRGIRYIANSVDVGLFSSKISEVCSK